jgi:histidine ammonia-lyase
LVIGRMMLAYELLAGIIAVRMRSETPGDGVAAVLDYFDELVAPFEQDRPPAGDVETILEHFSIDAFTRLSR